MKTFSLLAAAAVSTILLTGCFEDKTTPETAKTTVKKVTEIMASNNIEEFKKYCSKSNLEKYEKSGIPALTVPGLKFEIAPDPVKMSADEKQAEVVVNMSLQGAFESKSIWTLIDEGGEWKIYGDARISE